MSCFNLTGKPQTTAQAAEAKRKATAAAKERSDGYEVVIRHQVYIAPSYRLVIQVPKKRKGHR